MPSFYLTGKAIADLQDIARYTETTWGREQRNAYLEKLDSAFHDLAGMPEKGSRCDYIREGYRKYVAGKHLVFYRSVNNGEIEITRILHGRMDVPERLGED